MGNTFGVEGYMFLRWLGIDFGLGVPKTSSEKGAQTYPSSPRAGRLRECLGQVRYVAAADRPGKRRWWRSRKLGPTYAKAQRLSLGCGCASGRGPFQVALWGGRSARWKLTVWGSIQPSKSLANQTSSWWSSRG